MSSSASPLRLPRPRHLRVLLCVLGSGKTRVCLRPDVRLVLAKLWLHFVLDGSDCIEFGIDHLHDCLGASPSLSSHTTSPAATSTLAPGHDIDHGNPSRGSLDQGCSTHALGYLDIGIQGYHLACASPASSTVQASATQLRPRRSRYDCGGVSARWFLPLDYLQSDRPRRYSCSRHCRYDCGGVLEIY